MHFNSFHAAFLPSHLTINPLSPKPHAISLSLSLSLSLSPQPTALSFVTHRKKDKASDFSKLNQMRATIAPAYKIHLSPPVASSTTTACDGRGCQQWRPYSGTGDFEANAAMILIILLCALICALALNTAIRCFLRGHQHQHHRPVAAQGRLQQQQHKSNAGVAAAALEGVPALVYSADVRSKLAGAETECAICLSEFEEGQGVRLMARCNHGFHDQCIHQWLSSHSSCPTCRTTCLPPSPFTPTHTSHNCSSQGG